MAIIALMSITPDANGTDDRRTDRRRAIRYFFGGIAEVIDQQSQRYLLSKTSELGLLGCFVKAKNPFAPGTAVRLTITHEGKSFAASARVVYILADNGMGLAFETVSPKDQAVLNEWLGEAREQISFVWCPRQE